MFDLGHSGEVHVFQMAQQESDVGCYAAQSSASMLNSQQLIGLPELEVKPGPTPKYKIIKPSMHLD